MTATQKPNPQDRLEAAVNELVTSDGWARYLATEARFHTYSFGNIALIAMQRPTATRVAGFKAWQELGRRVRKGEHGIAILAPCVRKVDTDDGGTERRVVGFRTVHVFDVDQTDGEDLAEVPCHRLDSDSGLTDAIDALVSHAMAEGLDVERQSIPGAANGYINRAERRIVIDSELSRDQSFKTLVHELAHWHDLGESGDYDRADAEIVAESVAFIVASQLGLDTSSYSVGYVATWAGGDVAKLRAVAERVHNVARKIAVAAELDQYGLAA